MKRLFLIDAYALIFRYYYAFMTRPMRNREGLNTSPVFGFVKFLRDILRREQPDCLGVAFDPRVAASAARFFPNIRLIVRLRPKISTLLCPISNACARRCEYRCSKWLVMRLMT